MAKALVKSLTSEWEVRKIEQVQREIAEDFDQTLALVIEAGLERVMEENGLNYVDFKSQALDEELREELCRDKQILLKIVRENPGLIVSKIYAMYDQSKSWPEPRPTLREYMKDLEQRGLIESYGNRSKPNYKPADVDQ